MQSIEQVIKYKSFFKKINQNGKEVLKERLLLEATKEVFMKKVRFVK